MDFIKTLKKKTEAKIANIKSDLSEMPKLRTYRPKFDYESLHISVDCGPPVTEYFDESFNLRDFLKKFNLLHPTSNSNDPSYLDMQCDAVFYMKKLLFKLPVVEKLSDTSSIKKNKFHSHQPVEELTLEEVYYCNDVVLLRFLTTYEYKVEKSLEFLLKTLSWRRVRDPLRMKPELVEPSLCNSMFYRRGYDYFACPLVYFRPLHQTSASFEIQVSALYYTLERSLETCLLSQGCDKVCVIVDLKDWSLTKLPSMDLVIETTRALVEHYTETIDEIVFVDPPVMIEPVYQMVKCVIPTSTAKKLVFKSRGEKLFNHLRGRIPLCFLETSLGGLCDQDPDHKKYWEQELIQFQEYQNKVDEWVLKNKDKYLNKKQEF